MAEIHPEDVELLELVEEELPAERRSAVFTHVAACPRCADSVRLLEAGKAALRDAPRFELSPRVRAGIVTGLPQREPPRLSRRRLVAVLATVAVVAALAAVAVVTGPNVGVGGGEEEGAPAAAETSPALEEVGEAGEERSADASATLYAERLVAGPPAEVAEFLRDRGFDARVVGDHVEVRNADQQAVEEALADRRSGSVRVVVVR